MVNNAFGSQQEGPVWWDYNLNVRETQACPLIVSHFPYHLHFRLLYIIGFYLFFYFGRKHALNCHRMKPALFSVLCEIKEKTGEFILFDIILIWYYFNLWFNFRFSDVCTSVLGRVKLMKLLVFIRHLGSNSCRSPRRADSTVKPQWRQFLSSCTVNNEGNFAIVSVRCCYSLNFVASLSEYHTQGVTRGNGCVLVSFSCF